MKMGLAAFSAESIYNRRHCWAHHSILISKIHDLVHVFAIRVRIIATRLRAHVINTAIIIGPQKRARRNVQHPIIVFINVQILFREVRWLHAEVLRNAINIYIAKNGRCRFAAVRTIEAVYFAKSLFMQRMKCVIDILLASEILQELFVFLLELSGFVEVLAQLLR